jgi:phage tail sheath protein FI
MPFQLSPGVSVSEVDLTTVVPAVGTTTGALVGTFAWGPANQITLVSTENKLVEFFGKPTNAIANDFFTAANFLSYGNDLRVVRANTGSETAMANSNATGLKINNDEEYFNQYYTAGSAEYGAWAARYPGALGNSLKVSVCDSSNAFTGWEYNSLFTAAPGTSVYAANKGASNDELHIIVIDEDGDISGIANTVLEVYPFLSKASDAKNDDGSSNYYKEVIFRNSDYIHWLSVPASNSTNWGTVASNGKEYPVSAANSTVSLSNGTLVAATTQNVVDGLDLFSNAETVDVSLIMTAAANSTAQQKAIDVASTRKDCIAFVSPTLANCQSSTPEADIVAYKNIINRSTSYAVMDSGWKYQYDKYNDMYRWVPLNGDVAGLCVRTDNERDPWFSPAGFNRGQIRNIVKLAFNPSKTQRDELYKNGINPVVSFPGEGTVLFGDKTLLSKPSSFDRINVRRLFIVLEKAISRAARASLFEFNDEFTRSSFVNLVEPFLRDVQGRRGIYDFRVVCDTTNNTPEVIDRNEFVGDIYIKPAKSINFIQLNFVAVRTGVAFDEIVGRF